MRRRSEGRPARALSAEMNNITTIIMVERGLALLAGRTGARFVKYAELTRHVQPAPIATQRDTANYMQYSVMQLIFLCSLMFCRRGAPIWRHFSLFMPDFNRRYRCTRCDVPRPAPGQKIMIERITMIIVTIDCEQLWFDGCVSYNIPD